MVMDIPIKLVEDYFVINGSIKPISEFSYKYSENNKIIYEVIRVKNSTPIFFEQHLTRLFNSTKILGITSPSKDSIKKMFFDLLSINPVKENNIRLSLVYTSSSNFDILIYFIPSTYPTQTQMVNGVNLKTLNTYRENPNVKIENEWLRSYTDKIIRESGCYEVLLIDKDGFVTEGSRSNIFFFRNNELFTPPLETILGGITRQVVLNFSKDMGINTKEERISIDRIKEFDGAFLTGTSPGVLPIAQIESIQYKVNQAFQIKLTETYNKIVLNDISNFKKY